MFTKFQLGIIHAVSTVLFQENSFDYWTRSEEDPDFGRACGIPNSENDDVSYNLFTKVIDKEYYLGVELCVRDEYGELSGQNVLGYILIDEKKKCWELDDYCYKVEALIRRN